MPRATAGPQEATTRMPATTVPARPGSSPAQLSPAHLPPTVPGAAGQPGVPAATHVGQEDCRAAFGIGPGETRGSSPARVSLCLGPSLAEHFWVLFPTHVLVQLRPGCPVLSLASLIPTLKFPLGHCPKTQRGNEGPEPFLISSTLGPTRSSTSGSWAPECREEQSQSQPCPQPPCPPLCLHGDRPHILGDSWLQGECQQW